VDQISQGQGTLGKLTTDETLYRESTLAMSNLREIFEKINQGKGSVGKLVNDESLFRNAKMTLQKVEKATEGLEDQGPLSVLGTAVNSLF
jgi:phospholipid/cholesterol/gamma-HCH transport system substrate-binding protein